MVTTLDPIYGKCIGAFRKDCALLLKEFQETGSEDFSAFIPIWKAHKFAMLYERYNKYGHLEFFKEDSLEVAKTFMLNEHFAGGLFMLYGLYFIQKPPKQKIRLEYEDFTDMLINVKEREIPSEVKYQHGLVFIRLLRNDAFHFVTFSREFTMEGMQRSRLIFTKHRSFTQRSKHFCAKTRMDEIMAELGLKERIEKVQNDFLEAKTKFKQAHHDMSIDLDMVSDDFFSDLYKDIDDNIPTEEPYYDESIGNRRRRLKGRKMFIKYRYDRVGRPSLQKGPVKKPSVPGVEDDTSGEAANTSRASPALLAGIKNKPIIGCKRGKRKSYMKHLINDGGDSDSEDNSDFDFLDEQHNLSLPDI